MEQDGDYIEKLQIKLQIFGFHAIKLHIITLTVKRERKNRRHYILTDSHT